MCKSNANYLKFLRTGRPQYVNLTTAPRRGLNSLRMWYVNALEENAGRIKSKVTGKYKETAYIHTPYSMSEHHCAV